MLEHIDEWYIQRNNHWIIAKIYERHESRFKYPLVNSHKYSLLLKSNWVCADIFWATICIKRIKVSGLGWNKFIMKLEYQQFNILIWMSVNK